MIAVRPDPRPARVAARRRSLAFFRNPVPPAVIGLACILPLMALAGCAGQGTTRTGFIADYSQMKPTPGHVDDLVYVSPGFSLAAYHAAVVEPVVWQPVGKAPHLRDPVVARMTTAFRDALASQVGRVIPVMQPGPCGDCQGVLRVRAAITNIRRSKWYYNVVPMVIGMGAAAAGGALPPIPPPAPGGASEEIELRDARTGQTLVAISTYNNGMPWNPVGQITPFGHARRAFRLASQLLVDEMKAGRHGADLVADSRPGG